LSFTDSGYNSVDDFENLFFAHLSKHFLSIEKVADIRNERMPVLKVQSIDESCKLNDQLIVNQFIPCHKSVKDFVTEVENNISTINSLHFSRVDSSNKNMLILGSKVEIDQTEKEVLEIFAETNKIDLSNDFFDLGNLRNSVIPSS